MEILKEYSLLFPRGVAAGRKPQRSAWLLAVQARPVSEVSHSAQGLQPPLGARWATAVLRRAPQLTDPIEENRGPGTQRRDPGQRRTKRIKPHRRQTGGARKPQRTARLRAARPGPSQAAAGSIRRHPPPSRGSQTDGAPRCASPSLRPAAHLPPRRGRSASGRRPPGQRRQPPLPHGAAAKRRGESCRKGADSRFTARRGATR